MNMLCEGRQIKLRFDCTERKTMLIVGRSRMGKTYFASNLAEMLIKQGRIVHLIDLGDKWSASDKRRLQSAGAVVQKVVDQGIELVFHSVNELVDCAKVISTAIGFRSFNANIAMKKVFQKLGKKEDSIFSMVDVLKGLECDSEDGDRTNEWAMKVFERLDIYGEIPSIHFCVDKDKVFSASSTIWDLCGLDDEYVQVASSLLTYCLLCQQKRYFHDINKTQDMFIMVDEFQNLNCNRKSIIGTCLTEGQKYRLYLILITQFLGGNFSEAVINQFEQGGFRFYFRLTEEEAAIISKQIVPDFRQRNELYKKMVNLPVGNCLMLGPHSVGERREVTEAFRFVEIEGTEVKKSYNRGIVVVWKKNE